MLRFDPNLRWLFTDLPMLERYAAAAKAGFKGVEVAFPYEYPATTIASLLKDNDLTLVQILAPFDWDGGERGFGALPGKKEAFRKSVHTAVEYGAQVGKPLIHVMPGNLGPEHDLQHCMDIFVENLAWAADVAKAEGMTLILEPCCTARFPDFFYHRIDDGVHVIETVGRDNIKLCFDTYHIQMEGEGSIANKLREVFSHVGHIQVGNVPGRNEPGMGEIHFPYLFKLIEDLGWQGWIGCEYAPSGPTLETLDWAKPFGIGR